ncbi:hypothetical protein [Arthrobacter caoxuetaonis]|uniref:NfeD-like C-terminal domain-containing protein n=1 Tax=Arthrobacter caoxuetaonis TaxID=2886935 RepID=A0A9X1MG42_9MICC|nr:hypothetical protein [Arthrobacter caoxuetaonis]MCC3299469.1 hypothetical protein [Arthrobacter caoxuetaonis]USQ59039.1 hypothetical protein NF551_18205 [Arthrobacter caoxuetaonis]
MIAFLIVGGIGAALLLLSMLLGPVFDFLDVLDGALSGTAVGSGLTIFGASGALVLSNDGPVWLAYAVAAVLFAAAVGVVSRMTSKLQKASVQVPHEVIGLTGVSITRITGALGEVQLNHPREINKRLAFCDGVIGSGVSIVVTELHGSRVKVAPAPAAA